MASISGSIGAVIGVLGISMSAGFFFLAIKGLKQRREERAEKERERAEMQQPAQTVGRPPAPALERQIFCVEKLAGSDFARSTAVREDPRAAAELRSQCVAKLLSVHRRCAACGKSAAAAAPKCTCGADLEAPTGRATPLKGGADECFMCYSNPSDVANVPCGHTAMCLVCAANCMEHAGQYCVTCRQPVQYVIVRTSAFVYGENAEEEISWEGVALQNLRAS